MATGVAGAAGAGAICTVRVAVAAKRTPAARESEVAFMGS